MNPKIAKDLATGIGRVIDDTRVAVRQAEVLSVDTSAGVKVGIDVDGVQVDDVPCFNNVVPSVGDSAWVMTLRSGRWVVIGHTNGQPVSGGGGGGASVVVSDTEPASPGIGDLWFESDTGRTFLYYNDGSSYQWVEIGGNFGTFTGATPSGVDGSIQFALSGGLSSDASNLFWDDTNNRLGIGNNSPAHSVDVTGSGRFTSNLTIGAVTLPATDGTANQVLVTDGAGSVSWADQSGGGGASVTISDTAPSSPSAGDLWFESDTGKTFVYYDDGTSTQWVEVGSASAAASGTDGSIQFSSGGAFSSDASNLHWDDTNNRLGVGTASPNSKVHIVGDSSTNPTNIFAQGYVANVAVDTRTGTIRNTFDSNADYGTYWTGFRGANGSSYKSLFGVRTGGTDNDVLTIDSAGNVGIGTTSPAGTLDVNGKIHLAGGTNRYIEHRSGNNDILYHSDAGDFYRQDIANSSHQFFTGNTERLKIDSSGDVTIGGNVSYANQGLVLLKTINITNYTGWQDVTGCWSSAYKNYRVAITGGATVGGFATSMQVTGAGSNHYSTTRYFTTGTTTEGTAAINGATYCEVGGSGGIIFDLINVGDAGEYIYYSSVSNDYTYTRFIGGKVLYTAIPTTIRFSYQGGSFYNATIEVYGYNR